MVVRHQVKSKFEAQRVETACVEYPFRRFNCEKEKENVAITREVGGVKGELFRFGGGFVFF